MPLGYGAETVGSRTAACVCLPSPRALVPAQGVAAVREEPADMGSGDAAAKGTPKVFPRHESLSRDWAASMFQAERPFLLYTTCYFGT